MTCHHDLLIAFGKSHVTHSLIHAVVNEYMKDIYLNCGERYKDMIDHHSYTKNSGLNGIQTHGLCNYQYSALLSELSSQRGAGHIVSS